MRRTLARVLLVEYGLLVCLLIWWRGVPFEREQVVAIVLGGLIVGSVASGQRAATRALRDWIPLVVLLALYDLSRGAADTLGMPVQWRFPAVVDEAVFGRVPTVWFQESLGFRGPPRWWEAPVALVYASHFIVPFAVGGVLWWRDRSRWLSFQRQFIALTVLGLVTYVLVPTAPPWLAARNGFIAPVMRSASRGWELLRLDIAAQVIEDGQMTVNLVAALPSLHAAYPMLVALFFGDRRSSTIRCLLLTYPLAMGVVLVATGEHYVTDVALGWIYAGLVFAVARRRARALRSAAHA